MIGDLDGTRWNVSFCRLERNLGLYYALPNRLKSVRSIMLGNMDHNGMMNHRVLVLAMLLLL
jgi:hypothetical protein